MLREREKNRWKRGSCRARAQELRILGPIPSIPMAFEVSSAVRDLNTSVPEISLVGLLVISQVESRETVGGIELRPW